MRRSSYILLALAALLHLGLLIGWRWQLPLVPYFFDSTVLSGGRGLDFYSIYQAGYNARHGWDIYEGDPAKVEIVVPYFTPYRYLPIVAYTVGASLSIFSPLTAYKIWVVVIELTLLGCVALTAYRTRRTPDLAARLVAMWLVFTPYYLELFMGQFSLIQAALILAFLLAAQDLARLNESSSPNPTTPHHAHPAALTTSPDSIIPNPPPTSETATPPEVVLPNPPQPATIAALSKRVRTLEFAFGAFWLASILWKINTIIFTPVFLRLRHWRSLILTAAVVALTTLPYFALFPAHARDLLANNFGLTVAHHELGNLGFRQLVFEVLATLGASPALQRLAQWAVILVIGGTAAALTFRRGRPQPALLISLWLTAYMLASPQVWEHHAVMLLPVLVLAYAQQPGPALLLIWLFLALPTPFGFIGLQPIIAASHDLRAFPLEPAWQPLLQHASKALPTLALFIYLARAVLKHPSSSNV